VSRNLDAMRFRPFSVLVLIGAVCVAMPVAWAQSNAVSGDVPAQAREVRAWLMRIHEAASHRNFQGTFVVSGGGAVSSARIAHFCEGPSQFERSESLDGQARLVYRHNDVVTTVWPNSRVAMVEQRNLLAQFPATTASPTSTRCARKVSSAWPVMMRTCCW
jgi:sigma-E factor negative regulatory protein RseB